VARTPLDHDNVLQHLVSLVVDDPIVQLYCHEQATEVLGLPDGFGLHDEDEDHPMYDRYWEVYSTTTMHLLSEVSSKMVYKPERGNNEHLTDMG
jgi:hypothetical protein